MKISINNNIKSIKDLVSDLIGFDLGRSYSIEVDKKIYLEGKVQSGLDKIYLLKNKEKQLNILIKEKAIPHKTIYELFINDKLTYELYPKNNLKEYVVFNHNTKEKIEIREQKNHNAIVYKNEQEIAKIISNRSFLLPECSCELHATNDEDKMELCFLMVVWSRFLELNTIN